MVDTLDLPLHALRLDLPECFVDAPLLASKCEPENESVSEKWEFFIYGACVGIYTVMMLQIQFVPWLRCRLGWCAGRIDCDNEGTFWKCSRCGKITR